MRPDRRSDEGSEMPKISRDGKVLLDPAEALAVYLREELFDGDWDRHIAWTRAYGSPEQTAEDPAFIEELRAFEVAMSVNLRDALKQMGWGVPLPPEVREDLLRPPSERTIDPIGLLRRLIASRVSAGQSGAKDKLGRGGKQELAR